MCGAHNAKLSFMFHDPSGIDMNISSFAAFSQMFQFFNKIKSFGLLKVNVFMTYDARKNVVYTDHAFA